MITVISMSFLVLFLIGSITIALSFGSSEEDSPTNGDAGSNDDVGAGSNDDVDAGDSANMDDVSKDDTMPDSEDDCPTDVASIDNGDKGSVACEPLDSNNIPLFGPNDDTTPIVSDPRNIKEYNCPNLFNSDQIVSDEVEVGYRCDDPTLDAENHTNDNTNDRDTSSITDDHDTASCHKTVILDTKNGQDADITIERGKSICIESQDGIWHGELCDGSYGGSTKIDVENARLIYTPNDDAQHDFLSIINVLLMESVFDSRNNSNP